MKCSQVRKRLSAFLDGQGVEGDRAGIRQHLISCTECRRYAEELEGVSDDFELIGDLDVQPYFLTRVRQRIADQTASERNRRPILVWIRRVAVPAGITLGVALSALIGSSLGRIIYNWRTAGQTWVGNGTAGRAGSVLLDESPAGPVSRAYDALMSRGTRG